MPKRFKRRLDTELKLVKIEGLENIPLNPDGTVVYGVYVINYVWDYDGIRVSKPRTLQFRPPDNRIEFRKNGVILRKIDAINIISSQSTSPYSPTHFSSIDTSLPSDITAHYVERDIDDNITSDVDITSNITINTTALQASVVSNNLPEGQYVFFYEVQHNNGTTIYNKSLARSVNSVTYTVVTDTQPLYEFEWENLPLPTINKDVGEAFPSTAEMTDIIPIGVLTELATGESIRLLTTFTTPTAPQGGVNSSSTFLIKFTTSNLLSGSSANTGITDAIFNTYVVPQIQTRTIQYNLVTQIQTPLPLEITFSPSTLSDITFQDHESGSNPNPLSFYNNGLFPSEADLLSDVAASYVDDNGVTQPLTVSVTRPTGSSYFKPFKQFFFTNGEVNMHIPRTWTLEYSAVAPDGTTKTVSRNVVIEDTIAPVFSPTIPTVIEKGANYREWLDRKYYGFDYPRYDNVYAAPRYNAVISTDVTEQQYHLLDHGDTFVTNYTVTDNSGNTSLVQQTTTVQDTTLPTLTFNTNLVFLTGDNPTDEQLKVGVQAQDISQPVSISVDDSAVNYSSQGFYTVSYTATDAHGNSNTANRNVFVKDSTTPPVAPPTAPTGNPPVACPVTPGVPNIYLDGTEVIANLTDSQWIDGLFAAHDNEDITFNIIVSQNSINALPVTVDGTLDYDNNSDGFIDVEVTPLFINYEIQEADGTPIICTTRYIETIDVLPPTIYNIPHPILVYKVPNDAVTGQSTTTPNDVIIDIVSQINVVDNVDGTGFATATLEGIGQGDINAGVEIVKTLRFTDSSGNESRHTVTIQFTENQVPSITLIGDNPLTLTSSVLPVDPGATATDPEDGSLSVSSSWATTLGAQAVEGTFNVQYTATHSSGAMVEATRVVVVPYFPPSLNLLGNDPFEFISDPANQSDPFAEAYSVRDGDITANIVSDWDTYINASTTADTYTITYSITDSVGTTSTATRQVIFKELKGFLEELPFMPNPTGSATFASLDNDTMIPHDNGISSVTVPFPDHGRSANGDFTLSMWMPHGGGSTFSGNTAFWFIIRNTVGGGLASIRISSFRALVSAGVLKGGGTSWNDGPFVDDLVHLVWVVSGDNNNCKYYINGSLTSTIATVPNDMQDADEIFISNIPSPMARPIDSVDVVGGALSDAEVLDLYNTGRSNRFLTYYFINPKITLLGDNPLIIDSLALAAATDPGATAYDTQDGDLTNSLTSNWNTYINNNTSVGTYTITYSVTDSDGNTITATRSVEIQDCNLTTPNLYLNGSSTSSEIGSTTVLFQGTAAGLTTSLGKYNSNAFTFGTSGGNSMILSNVIDLSTGVYTFSAWFYNLRSTTGSGNWRALVKKNGQGITNAHYPIVIDPNDNLGIYKHGGGAFVSTGYSMTSFEGLQQWTHIAVVADGTNSTFYVNGQQVGNSIAAVIKNSVSNINGYAQGDQTWAEAVDEFAYWDKDLDPCEITKLYHSGMNIEQLICESIPTANLYFDGSSTSAQIGADTLNIRGGTASATGGKYAAAFLFTSTENACITPSNDFSFSGDATISFWMKEPDPSKDSWDYWFQVLRGGSHTFHFDNRSNPYAGSQGDLLFIKNGSQAQVLNYNISSLQDGQWHHFAFVKTGSNIDVYVDNVLVDTATSVPATLEFDQFNGITASQRAKFANYISDVAYWSSALQPCEIDTIYTSSVKLNDIE